MTLEPLYTIDDAFRMAAERHNDRPKLVLPASDRRDNLCDGVEWSCRHRFRQ